jgi:GH15 family glucan-1,4-alpha-glucosidase
MNSRCASALTTLLLPATLLAAEPHRSFQRLVTSNGHLVASYSRTTARTDTLLEHPYRFAKPRALEGACLSADETRDLAYDLFFGLRTHDGDETRGEWLSQRALVDAGLEPGTNVIVARQHAGPDRAIEAVTRLFAPFTLDAPVVVFTLTLRNVGDRPLSVTPYFLQNLHLGPANGAREPSTAAEEVAWDQNLGVFYEYSSQSRGTAAYVPLTPAPRGSVNAAYDALLRGDDLDGTRSTSGPRSDVVPALQGIEQVLVPGASAQMAVAVAWAEDENAAPLVDAVQAWSGGISPEALVRRELDAWKKWHDDAGTPEELRVHAALLRQAQVREKGPAFGQVLASLPPGLGNVDATWNITWVRDMAYAVAGLAHAGHLDEARDALLFQLRAPRGRREDYVGRPYRLSLTRYFGDGTEETDCNADGPNIEYDGFGLFLWSLGEYARAGGDLAPIRDAWPVLRDEIADVLVTLREPDGTVRADSSIWEVHWNGKQRKFTYTSLAAARGLCDAAFVANKLGFSDDATRWAAAGAGVRDAVVRLRTDVNGALTQSEEDLGRGHGYLDAATVEAINWGVVDPKGRVARATLDALRENLTVAHGRGLMRNDDGGWYDSQEWTFVDLRLASALSGTPQGKAYLDWVSDQARANDGYIAELGDPLSADALGSVPMVGFGAGAIVLASTMGPLPAACGAYAPEPAPPAPPPPVDPVDTPADDDAAGTGCGCGPHGTGLGAIAALFALARRRSR